MNKVFAMIAITITFMVLAGFSEPNQGMMPEAKKDSMGKIDRNTQYNETIIMNGIIEGCLSKDIDGCLAAQCITHVRTWGV